MKSIIIIFLSTLALNIIPFLLLNLFKIKVEKLNAFVGVVNIIFSFFCVLHLYDCIEATRDIYKSFFKSTFIVLSISIFFILFNILYMYTFQRIKVYANIISFFCFCLLIATIYNFFKYLPYKKYETIELELDKDFLIPAPLLNFIINVIVSLFIILTIKIKQNK